MKRNVAIVLVVAVLALLPCRAFAEVVINQTVPLSFTVADPCTGEAVHVSGTEHILISSTAANDGLHLDNKLDFHGDGTGVSTGTKYVLNESTTFARLNSNPGATFTETQPILEHLISQGSASNFLIQALIHITVNPDGTVTSSIDILNSECSPA